MVSCIFKQRAVTINANGGGECGRYLKEHYRVLLGLRHL